MERAGVPEFPDMDIASSGSIPWSADGYFSLLDHLARLEDTPKDDWDLRRRGVSVEGEEGEVQSFTFNMLHPMNQMGFYLAQKYRAEGVTVVASHGWRYGRMQEFLHRHRARLVNENMLRQCEEPGKIEINDTLIKALCELPYTVTRGRGRQRRKTFGVDADVRRAKEIDAASSS